MENPDLLSGLSMNMPYFTGLSLYQNRLAFCTPNRNMLGSESSRSASMLQQRAGFFVGKPSQNDRKKQVSHYPVIAMERIVHFPCAVLIRIQAAFHERVPVYRYFTLFNNYH
jgi:hypothetical protein